MNLAGAFFFCSRICDDFKILELPENLGQGLIRALNTQRDRVHRH